MTNQQFLALVAIFLVYAFILTFVAVAVSQVLYLLPPMPLRTGLLVFWWLGWAVWLGRGAGKCLALVEKWEQD